MSKENSQIAMVRPLWTHRQWFLDNDHLGDITVLVCQRKTVDLIRLTIESLLRFYPDIKIVVVDGDSRDDSTLYLRYKAITTPNLKLVEIKVNDGHKHNSHGETMDFAIKNHITTKYVLLMDSDLVIERHGFIEGMKEQIENKGLYATGTLMLMSEKGEGCRPPDDENDILPYAHPSCSLYNAETYKTLRRFYDHGAPCCWNMIDAKHKGLKVGYFPIDKYVSHLSGASWCEPQTIWNHDHDVYLRPFVTFITDNHVEALKTQTDRDFDIVDTAPNANSFVVLHEDGIKRNITNNLYGMRFKVQGEYVCYLSPYIQDISEKLVHLVKLAAIAQNAPNELNVGGLVFYKRNYWQNKICLE